MDGLIPVGSEQERPVRARRRSVWVVARAWRCSVVEVALRPTRAAAHGLAAAWLRVCNNEDETDVAVFRRVLPKED
jgi:hypothetical protein